MKVALALLSLFFIYESFSTTAAVDITTRTTLKTNTGSFPAQTKKVDGVTVAIAADCTWTAWTPVTPCNASCGYGNQTKARYQQCDTGLKNETKMDSCFTRKCNYEQLSCGKLLGKKTLGQTVSMVVDSFADCIDDCTLKNWCLGVNFCESGATIENCELLPSNSSSGAFVCEKEWQFYEKY